MPKVFVVEKAFLSTGEDKKTPQVINTQGGEMHKYMVQFKDQGIPGWIGILKKPGNSVSQGDEMYGVLEENNWGKPQFTRMQLPQDGSVQLKTASTPAAAPATPPQGTGQAPAVKGGSLEQKVDYIISLLENRGNFQADGPAPTQTSTERPSTNDGDAPVDLSQIDY